MMRFLSRLMYGRYGMDEFSAVLMIISLLLSILLLFITMGVFRLLFYVPLLFAVYRMLSKKIDRRRIELYQYQKHRNLLQFRLRRLREKRRETKTHKRYQCPQCRQSLRVPKGKGKINIRCPRCGNSFIKKT